MRLGLACLLALAVLSASAGAAVKPKPWQWPPAKVVTKLKASTPLVAGDSGTNILAASCTGRGKGVNGRYSRFVCRTTWGDMNIRYPATLTLRVLAIGTGKLCVVTGADGRALPAPGPPVKPQRSCP